ncbi:hypothetical protein PDIDSM_1175 [Penicillium digitatum]|nr:hypothetical protein PDIDSM_1175 [Penicillium digitatum]
MKLLWVALCLGSALASPIPDSHQLRLPFVPTSDSLENGVRSRLSIDLFIQNGSLYANEHQLYPPSVTMQLNAPLYEDTDQIHPSDKTAELSYTLVTQPIPTNALGSMADMIRVRVELFDLQGNLVSPDAVLVDLLVLPKWKVRHDPYPCRTSSWQRSGRYFLSKESTDDGATHDSAPIMEPSAHKCAIKAIGSGTATDSTAKTRFFSFWATPAHLHHHTEHRPHYSYHHKDSSVRTVRPIMIPALIGTAAGLMAFLIGFFVGSLLMSLAVRLGWQMVLDHRSRIVSVEEGMVSEKAATMPQDYVTVIFESNI